ncbi:hypothetical protein Dimus_011175 [Dionaea muscipula]
MKMLIPKKSHVALFASFSLLISPVIHADMNLIQEERRRASIPDLCIGCCESNPLAKKADAAGIAIIALGCIADHATRLAANIRVPQQLAKLVLELLQRRISGKTKKNLHSQMTRYNYLASKFISG